MNSFDQDLDYDRKNDFVTFTGCVFLTKIKAESIPQNKRCTADKITGMFSETFSTVPTVGQRYLSPKDNNFNLDGQLESNYTYLFEKDKRWYLVTANKEGTTMYAVDAQGILTPVPLPLDHQIHLLLYKISEIALVPLFYLTQLRASHF